MSGGGREEAQLEYERPDGERVHVAARTIEDWYYTYLKDGWLGLMPAVRDDRHKSRAICPEIAARLLAAKRQKPRRSIVRPEPVNDFETRVFEV